VAKSLLQTKVKKKPKKTHSEVFLVNRKYLGEEPIATGKVDTMMALNWYHSMADKDDAKEYLIAFLNRQGLAAKAKRVKAIPDAHIPWTAAWTVRIAERSKAALDPDLQTRVMGMIDYALTKIKDEPVADKPVAEKTSIQERMREKLSDIIGEIEALVDAGEVDLYEWLKKNEVPAAYAPRIADYYRPVETEMRLALIPKGQDGYIDGYENWSKADIRKRAEFYGKIVADAERYGDVTKKSRAPRKPRPVSMEKLLKNLKYLVESKEHKVASINPESIVGAQELWVFNTNSMVLGVYRAADRGGLSVKGSAVTNWDENTSTQKKVGRTAEASIKRVLDGGKLVLRKVMDEIKSKASEPNGRISNHVILLRAIK
jgi:hypothetical protein